MQMGGFREDIAPLHDYPPATTLPPYKSATGIGYASKKLVGNSASYIFAQ